MGHKWVNMDILTVWLTKKKYEKLKKNIKKTYRGVVKEEHLMMSQGYFFFFFSR